MIYQSNKLIKILINMNENLHIMFYLKNLKNQFGIFKPKTFTKGQIRFYNQVYLISN